MYCTKCGKEIPNNVDYCPYCQTSTKVNGDREANIGLKILSFLFPVLGVIFYLCFDSDTPTRSKQCGRWALAGVVAKIIFGIIIKFIIKASISSFVEQVFV